MTFRTPRAARWRWTLYWSGRYAIAATDGRRSLPAAPGLRSDSRRRARNRRAHRTAQAREPASHRHRAAARVGTRQRAGQSRAVGLHALSLPARPRTHPTPTAARQSHRAPEIRSRVGPPDLAVGHAVRPLVQRPGPGGYPGKMQVFLQAPLDDASRLIPHAQFYPDRGLDSFLDGLRQALAARGIPTRLYMDNAKIYRSPPLARIAASIGIRSIHPPPYPPEGRGKIERFFQI